jgi:hypothetical protein
VAGAQVSLTLSTDGASTRESRYDSVIAGTGFRPDVDRLWFLGRELREQMHRIDRAPRLNRNFESSVPGLYFAGPASAASFGPLFRFVVGAHYTSATLAGHLALGKRRAA